METKREPLTATEILREAKKVNDALDEKWDGVRRSFLVWCEDVLLSLTRKS